MTNMLNSVFNALASRIDSFCTRFRELTDRQTWHDALISVADATRFTWHTLRDVTVSHVSRKFRSVLAGDSFATLMLRKTVDLAKLTVSAVRYTYRLARAHAPKLLAFTLTLLRLLRRIADWVDPDIISSAISLARRVRELALKLRSWLLIAVCYIRNLYALPKLTC